VIRTGIRRLRHGVETVDHRVVDIYRSSWTHDPELWRQFGEPGMALADEHLDALWRFVSERGIAMTLVVYPWPDQILRRERDCVQVTHWRDWTALRGIGFVDLFPVFLDTGSAEQVVADFYIRGDMHWNQRGHELVARNVLERLRL
jgi:hypothetical protein